jgi:hypothetical protein
VSKTKAEGIGYKESGASIADVAGGRISFTRQGGRRRGSPNVEVVGYKPLIEDVPHAAARWKQVVQLARGS